ncbi:MAG: ABC transporter permease [Lachnospiraceae bacterium]|nr:ABC transporter permease [Lachnospiraceae bacterium]
MARLMEYIRVAWRNLKSNKGRSLLTMLGIIIGISSVIMIISAGGGAKATINDSLDSMFSGMVYFYVDDVESAGFDTFSEEDLDLVNDHKDEYIHGATYDFTTSCSVRTIRGRFDATAHGENSIGEFISTNPIIKGRYFNEGECASAASVCVLSENTAKKMFGTTDVIGKNFEATINDTNTELTVIGIRKDPKSAGAMSALIGDDSSMKVEMPYSYISRNCGFGDYNGKYLLIIADKDNTYEAAKRVKKLLEEKHGVTDTKAIATENWTDYSEQYDSILSIVTLLVTVVAGIALLVGGIGVMNIMLVSVTERTREIGIRKSLGAKTKAILMQFIAEASLITLIGGVIGIVVGLVLAGLICVAIGTTPAVSAGAVIVATLFSCGIGLFFGIYPAKKAAKLNPIEALRHE